MSHSNVGQTNFIGTHESVYRDSPIGNLEKVRQFNLVSGEISNNLKSGSKPVSLAYPSGLNQIRISLEIPVLHYRNRYRVLREQGEFHEGHGFREGLAVVRNIEFKGNSLGSAFASPCSTFNIADNLQIKRGALLG